MEIERPGGAFVVQCAHWATPTRQLKLVLAWNELHRDELMQNWELAKDEKPLNAVAPLM